jgi:hypothetical protein
MIPPSNFYLFKNDFISNELIFQYLIDLVTIDLVTVYAITKLFCMWCLPCLENHTSTTQVQNGPINYEFQFLRSQPAIPNCFSAASTVWLMSEAMVIGPTPPGTGV